MALRAERGRAVLVGAPELFQPPTALAGALDEWAEVAHAVCSDDDTDRATAELVSARGRQLAARLAAAAGTPVGYADPVLGVVEHVPPTPEPPRPTPWPRRTRITGRRSQGHDGTGHRAPGHGTTGHGASRSGAAGHGAVGHGAAGHGAAGHGAIGYSATGHEAAGHGASGYEAAGYRAEDGEDAEPHDAEPADYEPIPWASGLTVSAFAAVVVLAAVVTLVRGLAEVTWLLAALGLIMVTGGLAPSIWLARHTPLWRWVGFGVAAGITLSWISVLLATLGP